MAAAVISIMNISRTMKLIKRLSILLTAVTIVAALHGQEGGDKKARIQELETQERAANEAGRHDEANAIKEKVKRLRGETFDGDHGGDKLEAAKRRIEELRKAGKNEEANQLERRVREAGQKRRDGDKPHKDGKIRDGDKDPADKPRDGERGGDERMQHIEQAVKHLRAAGLHEQAERLTQMVREQHGQPNRQPGQQGGAPHEQMHRELREMQMQTQRAFRETQEQMAKMARVIDELREQVGKGRKERD